jgi:hypothetical protein
VTSTCTQMLPAFNKTKFQRLDHVPLYMMSAYLDSSTQGNSLDPVVILEGHMVIGVFLLVTTNLI